jgi:SAM-dependent methyltransferase
VEEIDYSRYKPSGKGNPMSIVETIYGEIRQSEMNDWVGGTDPEVVGNACRNILDRYLTINSSSRLLDFGCGIGRVLLSVLNNRSDVGAITGFDIMPQVIKFCDTHIASAFSNTKFEVIQGSNDHYDHFIAAASPSVAKSYAQLQGEYGSTFTGAYAFSVFTHVEIADFRSLLKFLSTLLVPGGELLFTAFLLTPFSRHAIKEGTALFNFGATLSEADGDVFIGNSTDRLSFIAFDLVLVEKMVFEAGLVITRMEHGSWSGAGFSSSLQDVLVCRRPAERAGPIQHIATVARPARA